MKFGAAKSNDYEKHSKEVENLESIFEVLPIYPVLDEFAFEKVRLQRSGLIIPDFDLLIGATAKSSGLTIF